MEEDNGLTIDDLKNVLRIINTATERSAFKANELSFVGQVYDKFSSFIRASLIEQSEASAEPVENGELNQDGD